MTKEKFLIFGENVEGFEITDSIKAPESLGPKNLWDLWDIGTKFGQLIEEKRSCSALEFNTDSLMIKLYNRNGIFAMSIAKSTEPQTPNSGLMVFALENGLRVFWDKKLTAADVQKAIMKIDQNALLQGTKTEGLRILLISKEPLLQ